MGSFLRYLLYPRSDWLESRKKRHPQNSEISEDEKSDSEWISTSPFQSLEKVLLDLDDIQLNQAQFDCLKQQILWDMGK